MINPEDRQFRFEVGICEVNFPYDGKSHHEPYLSAMQGIHFLVWAKTPKEAAEKVEKVITVATGTQVEDPVQRYLTSISEFWFANQRFRINLHVEKV